MRRRAPGEPKHKDILRAMFKEQITVLDRDMRMWCNYRARISDLRREPYNMCLRPCEVVDNFNNICDAYRYIPDGNPLNKERITREELNKLDKAEIVAHT